ncbi:DUF1152 domain-containing protein [Streptomyces achromogenes]|uniref:DUF1152 domain-containing protein n=1 Tax=Streptomyces achromogenes TaxID=67255 RepID=UPI00099C0EAD|nr:DUF1152 domain-containing protein [Streptomyces achromogenes]
MKRLIIAAGGGGDAVAAAMLHAALYGDEEPGVILTYAWDRLLIDPVPGPRGARDFTGLRPITRTVSAVPAEARPIAPAGSTLPLLAAALPHTFALLDPGQGTVGITCQLEELISHLEPVSIDLLDVGGDILARGDEPTLKSPLADALTLAAASQVNAPVRLLIAGPGLDGELPPDELRPLLGPLVHTLTAKDVEPISSILEWHPSEATAMLAATARGVRGTCEIRDAGLPIPLTDEAPRIHEVDLGEALSRNSLARALTSTTALDEAEAHSRDVCGFSEVDYERDKAAKRLKDQPLVELDAESMFRQLAGLDAEALSRGVTHMTFRRITEALNLSGSQLVDLRRLLISERPEQYDETLWRLRRPREVTAQSPMPFGGT